VLPTAANSRPRERGWLKVKNRAYWKYELEREALFNRRSARSGIGPLAGSRSLREGLLVALAQQPINDKGNPRCDVGSRVALGNLMRKCSELLPLFRRELLKRVRDLFELLHGQIGVTLALAARVEEQSGP
jgi:hypothetical protein